MKSLQKFCWLICTQISKGTLLLRKLASFDFEPKWNMFSIIIRLKILLILQSYKQEIYGDIEKVNKFFFSKSFYWKMQNVQWINTFSEFHSALSGKFSVFMFQRPFWTILTKSFGFSLSLQFALSTPFTSILFAPMRYVIKFSNVQCLQTVFS